MTISFPDTMHAYDFKRSKAFWATLRVRRFSFVILALIAVAYITIWLLSTYNFSELIRFPWFIAKYYGIGVLGWLVIVALIMLMIWRNLGRDKSYDIPRQFGFDEEAAYTASELFQSRLRWDYFTGWIEGPHVFLLFVNEKFFVWPKELWSETELHTIRDCLHRNAAPRHIWLRRHAPDAQTRSE